MYLEDHDSITATELARNLSTIIDHVRIHQHGRWITKGSQTVAELRPPKKAGYPIAQLGKMLASLPLGEESAGLVKDQTCIRHQASLPVNPWDL